MKIKYFKFELYPDEFLKADDASVLHITVRADGEKYAHRQFIRHHDFRSLFSRYIEEAEHAFLDMWKKRQAKEVEENALSK